MLTIHELLKDAADFQPNVAAVADIEAFIQSQAPWHYSAFIELLEQDSVQLLVVFIEDNNNKHIVGYCLYQVVFEQAEILRIGTHPDYQRQGIASQIFATLNEGLINNEVESLMLEVRADNLPAIALYKQQGFGVIHRRKGYYKVAQQPAIDALIMQQHYVS